MRNDKIGHVISHTHWDREWRSPLWQSRKELVAMMDSLVDRLKNDNAYKAFLFDGQVIAIEDYLKIRPEKKEVIYDLISKEKLFIGPWYNLPDEYPVAGEALIRNLCWGIKEGQKYGGSLMIGYTSFGWGQTAQLPQIYKGFGIDFIVVGKHVSKERTPHSEFFWQAPDGTKVLTTRLGDAARSNFFFNVFMPVAYGENYYSEDWGFKWPGNGIIYHPCNNFNYYQEFCYEHNFVMQKDLLKEAMQNVSKSMRDSLEQDNIFMGDGCDYSGPNPLLKEIIDAVNNSDYGIKLKHSTLNEYACFLKKKLKGKKLQIVQGELRDGPVSKCSGNALSIRMSIKSINRKAQHLLINMAEPFSVLSGQIGVEYPKYFLNKAWHYLLTSHSHDAINGVTLDKTARDIEYRLEQVVEISETLFEQTASQIIKNLSPLDANGDEVILVVFNTSQTEIDFIEEVYIDIPSKENAKYLMIEELDGNPCNIQPCGYESSVNSIKVKGSRALPFQSDKHKLYLQTGTVPAFGYKTLKVKVKDTYNPNAHFWEEDYNFGSQLVGPNTMANKHIEVQVNSDGTVNIKNKQTGRSYSNLNYFEDSGDSGDYWQRREPNNNTTLNTLGTKARLSLIENGPLVTVFRADISLEIPSKIDRYESTRSAMLNKTEISVKYVLKKSCPYLEVETSLNNTAEDHRLRIALPSYLEKAEYSFAQGHFYVDKRPIWKKRDIDNISQAHMKTLPHQNFISISDGYEGLAVLNHNLIEYEVSDDDSKTLYLTLLRCVPIKICSEFRAPFTVREEKGSQSLGTHKYHYAILPHDGDWIKADIYNTCENYLTNARIFQTSSKMNGKLCHDASLLSVESGGVWIESIKKEENGSGIVIRMFNPYEQNSKIKLKCLKRFKSAHLTNFNEQIDREVTLNNDGSVTLSVDPYKIMTLLCGY